MLNEGGCMIGRLFFVCSLRRPIEQESVKLLAYSYWQRKLCPKWRGQKAGKEMVSQTSQIS